MITLIPRSTIDTSIIRTPEQLIKLRDSLARESHYALDTETDMKDDNALVGMSFFTPTIGSKFVPIGFRNENFKLNGNRAANRMFDMTQVSSGTAMDILEPIFRDKTKFVIGHNIKFDAWVIYRTGCTIRNKFIDTLVMAWMKDENYFVGLKPRVFLEFGVKMTEFMDLVGRGSRKECIRDLSIPFVAKYAKGDAKWTYELFTLYSKFLHEKKLYKIFSKVMMPLLKIIWRMERNGVCIDENYLNFMGQKLEKDLLETKTSIFDEVGKQFNINSTKQLQQVLFVDRKLTPVARTKKGAPSTDVDSLTELAKKDAVCKELMHFRSMEKLRGTYIEGIRERLQDGKIHASFNMGKTLTGRLSSSDPNLQNIPIRVALGKEIRNIFVAPKGWRWMMFDEKNIELRLIAHFARDPVMIRAFLDGKDLHSMTASRLFSRTYDWVVDHKNDLQVKRWRDIAKSVNFGIAYGQGSWTLSESLEISKEEAQKYIDGFFSLYPNVFPWIESIKRFAHKNGYVRTLMGRYRRIPEIGTPIPSYNAGPAAYKKSRGIVGHAERQAVNSIIQGTAFDILAMAMVKMGPKLKSQDIKMLIQVHDELDFMVRKECVEEYKTKILYYMENPFFTDFKLRVPIEVDCVVARRWGDTKG